jgi:hypothetical protein
VVRRGTFNDITPAVSPAPTYVDLLMQTALCIQGAARACGPLVRCLLAPRAP